MVAVVSGPSQSQFRQVARTDDECIHLVGIVHQDLSTFTGLTVFVGHVVVGHVVVDILEVLDAGILDADFVHGDSEGRHQVEGIVISTVGSAESRHGDAHDSLAGEAQLVEGLHAYQQGKGRVQTSGNAHYHGLAIGVNQSLGQAHYLNFEDFFATLVQHVAFRHERTRVDGTGQYQVALVYQFGAYVNRCFVLASSFVGRKSGVGATFVSDAFHIDFADNQLLFQREPFGRCQHRTIFVYQAVASEHHIGGRFAESA